MNKPVVAWVGWLLLVSALGFYVYGMERAIEISWPKGEIDPTKYPETLETIISSLQALLLANLGMVLGIAIAKPESALARNVLFNQSNVAAAEAIKNPLELKDKIQLWAMVIYLLSLIACVVVWVHKDFTSETKFVLPVISQSGKMFFGVILAYVTAVLSK